MTWNRRHFLKLSGLAISSAIIGRQKAFAGFYNTGAFWKKSASSSSYSISNSLRFHSAAGQYLSKTMTTPTLQRKWTYSCWIKRIRLGAQEYIFMAQNVDSYYDTITFNSDDTLEYFYYPAGYSYRAKTTGVFRDPSAWYHILINYDSSAAITSTDRIQIWVNGIRQTLGTYTAPGDNATTYMNSSGLTHRFGSSYASQNLNVNLADVYFIDGQTLPPTSFGETDATTNQWNPKAYSGDCGRNGFHLEFKTGTNTTTLGEDTASIAANHTTANNFSLSGFLRDGSVNDSWISDSPNQNFCTLNLYDRGALNVRRSNLEASTDSGGGASWRTVKGTHTIETQCYFEITIVAIAGASPSSGYAMFGIGNKDVSNSSYIGAASRGYAFQWSGYRFNNGSQVAYGSTCTTSDTLMCAVDLSAGNIWFGRNGSWFNSGNPSTGTNPTFTSIPSDYYYPMYSSYFDGVDAYCTGQFNFGQRTVTSGQWYSAAGGYFRYTPPTGFKALSSATMPTPTITKPQLHFDIATYTGDGTSPKQIVSGLQFQPDLVWVKSRTSAQNNNIYDSVRGAGSGKLLIGNMNDGEGGSTGRQDSVYGYISSFNSNGVTATAGSFDNSALNQSSQNFVAWLWKAGGSPNSNTNGTITTQVSANTVAGFSILTYTGTGTAGTIGHGLGVTPKMVWIKDRSYLAGNSDWIIGHENMHANPWDNYYVYLNLNYSRAGTEYVWSNSGNNPPTSSVIKLGYSNQTNGSGRNYLGYVFTEVSGFSRINTYTGNGSTDGPFAWCGFRPSFVLIKRIDANGNWSIFDNKREPYNVITKRLYSDSGIAEDTSTYIDFFANGFKIRTSSGDTITNASGATYIFIAFAETPFKYARAR